MARAENLAGLGCMPYLTLHPLSDRIPAKKLSHYRTPRRLRFGEALFPHSDERLDCKGRSVAVGTTGGAAVFNCLSSACTFAQSFGFRFVA